MSSTRLAMTRTAPDWPRKHAVCNWILLLLLLSAIGAFGQRSSRMTDQSSLEDSAGSVMSAEQIFEILRGEPLLLEELRGEVVLGLENGESSPDGQLTDAMLFRRIQEDPQTRAEITRELRIRGFELDDSAEAGLPVGGGIEAEAEDLPDVPQTLPNAVQGKPAEYVDRQKKAAAKLYRGPARRTPGSSPAVPHLDGARPQRRQDEAVQRPNPYKNVPALADLYTQFGSAASSLERFGLNLFRTSNGNHSELPMDLPAGNDYVLGPGDGLNIDLWAAFRGGCKEQWTAAAGWRCPRRGW